MELIDIFEPILFNNEQVVEFPLDIAFPAKTDHIVIVNGNHTTLYDDFVVVDTCISKQDITKVAIQTLIRAGYARNLICYDSHNSRFSAKLIKYLTDNLKEHSKYPSTHVTHIYVDNDVIYDIDTEAYAKRHNIELVLCDMSAAESFFDQIDNNFRQQRHLVIAVDKSRGSFIIPVKNDLRGCVILNLDSILLGVYND